MLYYHMLLMFGGYGHFRRYRRTLALWRGSSVEWPTVSILIPAHNEEVVIKETLEAMLKLNYPADKLEIIVINDNSKDNTGAIAEAYAQRHGQIKVVHTKPPLAGKGKSCALNQGFAHSTGEVIIVYDADNLPEPDAVYHLVLGLVKDRKAGAIVGKFRVFNARKNILTRLIHIETLTFQWLAQAGRWFWFGMTTIPGTNFAIRRTILEKLGGWDEKALSEDTELSIRVYNLGYYIRFFPAAITWEQEPESWKVWWKQRTRWARGNIYVLTKYLLSFSQLNNKKVVIDLVYFLSTYLIFFIGIMVSHLIFVLNLFVDLNLKVGLVSYVLILAGFLLYVTESLLALSLEKGELTLKNLLTTVFMYFSYSQLWIFLIIRATYLECKRVVLKQELTWYKTERFKQELLREDQLIQR